ncbi:hypothetical protein [Arcobacter sp. CECT 8986]|uniref:hypothetical protein n=1 Tax=Arcobacter sp. CECT 8986 TaxID=2044507 RepID=UPI0013E99979|nr:hypothetical protein [Arcobacter sp. CECT 8986]
MNIIIRWLFNKVKPIYIIPILLIISFFSIYVFPAFLSSNINFKLLALEEEIA